MLIKVEEGTARAMCYVPVLGILAAIVFVIFEKDKKIKWDAVQALALWVSVLAVDAILTASVILKLLIPAVNLVGMVIIPLVLAIRASQKEDTKLPFLGEIVNKFVK